ncbi:MAG: hypothetical protein H0X38_01160 [Planctomycetes bacterium]|nr:hypothetical protein [Planctomycetota bacterium]
MKRPAPPTAAFTLIEMMIAIALGMLIILTAVAGFRTASTAVTSANRLSLENNLLRAGYWEAQNQLDFWTNLDDPNHPDASRPLKAIGAITDWTGQGRQHGLPFTPMYGTTSPSLESTGVWPRGGTVPRNAPVSGLNGIMPGPSGHPTATDAQTTDTLELDKGWDPTFAWAPHDPRTWSRANMAEKDRDGSLERSDIMPPMINGRYAIFGNTGPGATLRSYNIVPDFNDPMTSQTPINVTYTGYSSGGVHPWYYRQLDGLINAMGYAAFCDYLPANAIYTWYSNSGDRTPGDINKFGISPNYNFCNWDGNQRSSRGIYRNTYATSFGYLNPRSSDTYRQTGTPSPPGGNNLRQWHYQHYESDYNAYDTNAGGWSGVVDLQWFLSHTCMPERLMTQMPAAWPQVQVCVGRLLKNAHFVAVAKVRRTAPLTGEVIELSWCGLGTSLRGARQQRLRDGQGWARWDNAPSATIDPNLDSPP